MEGKQALARDAFMFAYYCCGMRAGDLLSLTRFNFKGDRMRYVMEKNGKEVNIWIPHQAREILDRMKTGFIFHFDQHFDLSNMKSVKDKYAYQLKKIGEQIGVPGLSSHYARGTFGDLMARENMNESFVLNAYKHSDLRTSNHYMGSFNNHVVDNGLKQLFG